jgi:hypothetical protein
MPLRNAAQPMCGPAVKSLKCDDFANPQLLELHTLSKACMMAAFTCGFHLCSVSLGCMLNFHVDITCVPYRVHACMCRRHVPLVDNSPGCMHACMPALL